MSERTPPTEAELLEARRRRGQWRLVGLGAGLGVLGAVGAAVVALPGGVGMVAVLLGTALGCVAAALLGVGLAVVDESRGHRVAARRMLRSLGLFLLALVLVSLAIAAVGSPPTA